MNLGADSQIETQIPQRAREEKKRLPAREQMVAQAEPRVDEEGRPRSLYARVKPWREGPIPEAEELDVDVRGLSPELAEVAKLSAWRESETKNLDILRRQREYFLRLLFDCATNEAELKELERQDDSGYVRYLRERATYEQMETGEPSRWPPPNSFERERVDALEREADFIARAYLDTLKRSRRGLEVLNFAVEDCAGAVWELNIRLDTISKDLNDSEHELVRRAVSGGSPFSSGAR